MCALRHLRAFVMAPLALLACSDAEPGAMGVRVAHRFLAEVDPSDPWKEQKERAADEYRNVLSPAHSESGEWVSRAIEVPLGAELDLGVAVGGEGSIERRLSVTVEADRGGERIGLASAVGRADGWQDMRVDLSGLAGQKVRFVLRSEPPTGHLSPGTRALWSNPLLLARAAEPPTRPPNLILISLDTLRADHLGAYGYERETSPNLDRFMEEGLVFERCFAPSSWTTPSHATVFTGMHPAVHGADATQGRRLGKRFTTLAELARRRGHATAAFTEGVAVAAQLGFQQGFDSYANGPSPRPVATAESTFARATAWLERYGELPFLLFVHTYEIHGPYQSPAPYAGMFLPEGVPPLSNFARGTPNDTQKQGVVAEYDAGIAYTDAVLGRFFDTLRARGLLEHTIVVLFSDHGEEFWEHGSAMHGLTLYDEVLHVPLFIRLPGAAPPRGRIQQVVALGDLFATLVELMGFDEATPGYSFSLRPLWDPDAGSYDRELVTSELVHFRAVMLAARSDRHKYIVTSRYYHEESPLYHLQETIGDPPTRMERLLMDHLLAGAGTWRRRPTRRSGTEC